MIEMDVLMLPCKDICGMIMDLFDILCNITFFAWPCFFLILCRSKCKLYNYLLEIICVETMIIGYVCCYSWWVNAIVIYDRNLPALYNKYSWKHQYFEFLDWKSLCMFITQSFNKLQQKNDFEGFMFECVCKTLSIHTLCFWSCHLL